MAGFWFGIVLSPTFTAISFLVGVPLGIVAIIRYSHWTKTGEMFHWYGLLFHQLGVMLEMFACIVGAVVILIALQTTFASRWRTITISVLYKGEYENVAEEIKTAIQGHGIRVQYLPMAARDHDEVIDSSISITTRADILVVLPGPEESFVSNEVFLARSLMKPVLIVKMDPSQFTLNSQIQGYPLLDLSRLRNHHFRPLARFVNYLCESWRDGISNFPRVAVQGIQFLLATIFGMALIVGIPMRFVFDIIKIINFGFYVRVSDWFMWVIVAVSGIVAGWVYVRTVFHKLKAIRVARQKVRTREHTYESLEEGFSFLAADRLILECLDKAPLPTRHQP